MRLPAPVRRVPGIWVRRGADAGGVRPRHRPSQPAGVTRPTARRRTLHLFSIATLREPWVYGEVPQGAQMFAVPLRAPLTLIACFAAAGCTVHVDSPELAGQDVRLTIIHTADIHSRLFPYQFAPGAIDKGLGLIPTKGDIAVVGGIARVATVIARERAASQRVLHLDSGDIFEGAPVFNTFAGE